MILDSSMESCVPIDYAECFREVVALADRGLMKVRVTFPEGRSMTVWGALNKFHLWKYVSATERDVSLSNTMANRERGF